MAGGDPALVVAVVEVADLDGQGESASAGVDVEDFGGGEGVEFVEDAVGEAALVEACQQRLVSPFGQQPDGRFVGVGLVRVWWR